MNVPLRARGKNKANVEHVVQDLEAALKKAKKYLLQKKIVLVKLERCMMKITDLWKTVIANMLKYDSFKPNPKTGMAVDTQSQLRVFTMSCTGCGRMIPSCI